jgi:hypothetical protein
MFEAAITGHAATVDTADAIAGRRALDGVTEARQVKGQRWGQ